MQIYDRAYKLPVILETPNLSEEERSVLLKSLQEFEPQEITYPSQYAIEVCKDMSKRGWPSLARPLPLFVSSSEAVQIFARCIKTFNENANIRRVPDTSSVSKKIESVKDFEQLVDDLTAQQDDITLSHIFKTDKVLTNVFWTTGGEKINAKLSDNIIRISRLGETEKDVEKRIKSIQKQINSALESAKESGKVTFKDEKNSTFRYR